MGSSQGERSRLSWKTNPSAGQLDADSLVKTIEMDFFFKLFISFWLLLVFFAAQALFSFGEQGLLFVETHELLTAVIPLDLKHELWGRQSQ